MSIQQTRTCKKCRQENLRDAKFCTQCGAELEPLSRRAFLVALALTALLFIIMPIYLVSDIDESAADLTFGFTYIAAFLFITFLMAVYLGVGAIVAVIFQWRKNRSVAHGVFLGLGVGLLLGVASCTTSFAVLA